MFLIWMCTRPAAAVVMLFISVSGQLLIPSGNPILLLLWLIVAFGGGWAYFLWLPEVYRGRPLDKPMWIQVNPDAWEFSTSRTMEMMETLNPI